MVDEDSPLSSNEVEMLLYASRQRRETIEAECEKWRSVEGKLLRRLGKTGRDFTASKPDATFSPEVVSDPNRDRSQSEVDVGEVKPRRERDPGSRRKRNSQTDALKDVVLGEARLWWAMAAGKRAVELGVIPEKNDDLALRKGAYALLVARAESGDIKRIESFFMAPDFMPSEAELIAARAAVRSNMLTYSADMISGSS